ncbi:putative ribonuclease H-like domain-containing protein [Tanacetum coccineum]
MTKTTNEQGFISAVFEGKTHEDLHTCLFACFLSQEEPKKVWTLVDLPYGKRAIGTKWVYRNKKDERGIVIRNKVRLCTDDRKKCIFLFLGKIEEEVYVCQPPGFEDLEFPDIVYKVEKALYGLHQAPRSLKNPPTYQRVTHLHAMKRIFRYLKGQPKLGLWYPKDSPFDLEAYTDSDYAGASLDRKSTTGSCQFLGSRLISWQCKKHTIVANSTTEAKYVAAASCYRQVLWIQNQMMDYGYNFMNNKIFIDNESTICIVKNQVFHSKTRHIEIRHHFIKDFNEKKLIQMIKIHTDQNVTDLLTKAFDVGRFQYLIASIEMLNL